MRWLLVVGLIASADAAPSAKTEIEKLVRADIVAIAQHKRAASELSLADDVLVYQEMGNKPKLDEYTQLGDTFYADEQAGIEHVPERVDVVVADPVAWFQVTYRVIVTSPMDPKDVSRYEEHAAGIAIRGPHGWAIEAIGYGALVSDHDLVTSQPRFMSNEMPTGAPTLAGDPELAKAAAAWIANGFAGHAASAGALASGSAPGENGTSVAAVAKLVKGWDALGLRASAIEATVLPGGKAGLVHLDVAFPIKGTKRAAPLLLNLGAVREADGWHWAVVSYGAPMLM